jgi:hypothetical protein
MHSHNNNATIYFSLSGTADTGYKLRKEVTLLLDSFISAIAHISYSDKVSISCPLLLNLKEED